MIRLRDRGGAMDDDWRGLDWEWLRRIGRGAGSGRAGLPLDELRRWAGAMRDRRARPVLWIVESPVPRSAEEERLATVGAELGLDRWGRRRLDAVELMERFPDDEAAGLEVARRLVTLGFCRRACPGLGVTDRYYCRGADERAELGRQVARWLRDS
jgi:hypothetical protein